MQSCRRHTISEWESWIKKWSPRIEGSLHWVYTTSFWLTKTGKWLMTLTWVWKLMTWVICPCSCRMQLLNAAPVERNCWLCSVLDVVRDKVSFHFKLYVEMKSDVRTVWINSMLEFRFGIVWCSISAGGWNSKLMLESQWDRIVHNRSIIAMFILHSPFFIPRLL